MFRTYQACQYFLAVIAVHVTRADPCSDLDPRGCAANPDLCLDDLLARVTCPVTCGKCRKGLKIEHKAMFSFFFNL